MRHLGEQLHGDGYTVNGVCLAGHATTVEDLARCRWQDWYQSVEDGLAVLSSRCRRTVVAGLSLGSLLALHLAHQQPQTVSALVLMSSALVIANPWPARAQQLLRAVLPMLPDRWCSVSKGASDIADEEARRTHPGYRALPVASILELVALQRQVRTILAHVAQPALVIHSREDHTTPVENVSVLERELPNVWGTVMLPAGYHVLTVDLEKQRVVAEVASFIESLTSSWQQGRTPGYTDRSASS